MSGSGEIVQQQNLTGLWAGLRELAELPDWLAATREPERVCRALAQIVPEFAFGRLVLEGCDVGHMRFKRDYWEGTYELIVREPGAPETKTIELRGMTYPPGAPVSAPTTPAYGLGDLAWSLYLPELNLGLTTVQPETVLSSLALLIDPDEACQYLEESIRNGPSPYRDISIQGCQIKVVRYKPGSRCTILYWPEYSPNGSAKQDWPHLIVAKTYRNEKGQTAFDGMQALWNSPLATSGAVTIAEPLAYNPEKRVLLQGPIREEQTLKDLMYWTLSTDTPEAYQIYEDHLRKTAAALAAVHSSGVGWGPSWNWENRADEIRDRMERLGDAFPKILHSLDKMMVQLTELAGAVPPDPVVPSHGSFRPAQVLLHQGQIGFIDFDSFSQSEPALDIALFLATITSIGLDTTKFGDDRRAAPLEEPERSARLEKVLALSEVFVDEYQRFRPVSRQRIALWEALDITMLVLQSWIKVKTFRLQDSVFLLEQHLHRMGL